MGIFDVFKTKMSGAADKAGGVAGQAWDKAGDVAGQAKDKVSDMMDKKKGEADDPSAPARGRRPEAGPAEDGASTMVSEGAPVAAAGEAAPGVGDDGAPAPSELRRDDPEHQGQRRQAAPTRPGRWPRARPATVSTRRSTPGSSRRRTSWADTPAAPVQRQAPSEGGRNTAAAAGNGGRGRCCVLMRCLMACLMR